MGHVNLLTYTKNCLKQTLLARINSTIQVLYSGLSAREVNTLDRVNSQNKQELKCKDITAIMARDLTV